MATDLRSLDPGGADSPIAIALSFLRLVAKNNPNTKVSELIARPDVKSAHGVIGKWLSQARSAASEILEAAVTIPGYATENVKEEAQQTLAGIRHDTRISRANLKAWADDQDATAWAAKIILRMTWYLQWLQQQKDAVDVPDDATHKTWVSRLAPNTCKYCAALHGITIPLDASFAPYAISVGFTRVYGGLFGPGLHPNCQCTLRFS